MLYCCGHGISSFPCISILAFVPSFSSVFLLHHSSTFMTAGKPNAWWPLSPLLRSRRGWDLLQLVEYTRLVYLLGCCPIFVWFVLNNSRWPQSFLLQFCLPGRQDPEAKKQQEIDGPVPQKRWRCKMSDHCQKLHDAMIWEIQISEATSHRQLLRWFRVSQILHMLNCKNPIGSNRLFPALLVYFDTSRSE